MSWLVILLILFAGLHLGLLVPTQLAIAGAAMLVVSMWLLWKLKWVILGIIGLEEFFGGRGDGA
ncbi:MAG: hypothetical protein WCD70_15425 [Alphaproteobacteria bacterium]